jgi:hypothetical protein
LFKPYRHKVVVCVAAAVAITSSVQLSSMARAPADEGISHVMPAIVTVLMGLGDRYLAANLLVINSIISIGEGDTHFKDKSQLHMQAAYLNGFNEDNYYQTAASLPWHGFVDEAQAVLTQARKTRYFDPWAAFYEGFSEFYFYQNYVVAAQLATIAGARAEGNNRSLFTDLAAKWLTSSANYKLALTMVDELARSTKSVATKQRLQARKQRLLNLIMLEQAVIDYQTQFNHVPANIAVLVNTKIIAAVPIDPWGKPYVLTNNDLTVGVGK